MCLEMLPLIKLLALWCILMTLPPEIKVGITNLLLIFYGIIPNSDLLIAPKARLSQKSR